jgi:hypothetical protein
MEAAGYNKVAEKIDRLSAAKVKHAKPGMHLDGGGLYLQVTEGKNGQINKSWLYRFVSPVTGKERQMGLGSLSTVGLADARAAAQRCRKMVYERQDPIEERNAERAARIVTGAKAVTFDWCAQAHMKAHESGWKNAKHRAQWRSTLDTYVSPIIGRLPVGAIDTGLIMQILQPICTEKNETASRVRGRIEKILDWARVNGYRGGDNPASPLARAPQPPAGAPG